MQLQTTRQSSIPIMTTELNKVYSTLTAQKKNTHTTTTSYTYDNLSRLETVSEPNGKLTAYIFDLAGNRATQTITQSVYDAVYGTTSNNVDSKAELIEGLKNSEVETILLGEKAQQSQGFIEITVKDSCTDAELLRIGVIYEGHGLKPNIQSMSLRN